MSFRWWQHFLGSCSGVDSLDICWGFAVHGSCCLCSSLCSSLGLGLYSYRYSLEQGCYSSNEGRWMSCTGVRSAPGVASCSIAVVVVGERTFRRVYFLRIRFSTGLLIEHLRGPSRCVLGR